MVQRPKLLAFVSLPPPGAWSLTSVIAELQTRRCYHSQKTEWECRRSDFFLFFFCVGWLILSLQEVLRLQTSPSPRFFASNDIQRQGNHRRAFVGGSEFPKYRRSIHHFHSHSIVPDHTYAPGDHNMQPLAGGHTPSPTLFLWKEGRHLAGSTTLSVPFTGSLVPSMGWGFHLPSSVTYSHLPNLSLMPVCYGLNVSLPLPSTHMLKSQLPSTCECDCV